MDCGVHKHLYVQLAVGPAGIVVRAAMQTRDRVARDVCDYSCAHSPYGARIRVLACGVRLWDADCVVARRDRRTVS